MVPESFAAVAIAPVQRIKFDRYLFDHDIDNVRAGELFGAHPLTIGRWRKRFDDDSRRVPPRRKIAEIAEKTGGAVALLDWYRPSPIAYLDAAPVTAPPQEAAA